MTSVVVTGSRGFLGRAVCTRLMQLGHTPVGYDLPAHDVRRPVRLGGAAHVIHLAGLLGTDELFDAVHDAIDVNITGTVRVLEACRQEGAAYTGITMPDVFPSVYTATKVAASAFERAFHHAYRVPVSRVRAFNAYGAGQRYGPGYPRKIIPVFSTMAWLGQPIPVYGDGEQTVDLIHANDLARMLTDAMRFGQDVTFDGGTGKPLTVNQVAQLVLEVTGSRGGVEYLPQRRGEVHTFIAAKGTGWGLLGWHPRFSESQFAAAVESYKP